MIISDTNPYIHLAQKGDLRCKMDKCGCCSNKYHCTHYKPFVCNLCQYRCTCTNDINIYKPIRDMLLDMLKEEIERCSKEVNNNVTDENVNA